MKVNKLSLGKEVVKDGLKNQKVPVISSKVYLFVAFQERGLKSIFGDFLKSRLYYST